MLGPFTRFSNEAAPMFNAEDLLDIALRLEHNGEKIYRNARRQTADDTLQRLLERIAREESSHADRFSNLKNRLPSGEDHHLVAEMSRALVEDVVKGQAFSLQEVDFAQIDTPRKMVRTFIGFEEDTIAFYETIGAFISDPAIARILETIIAEERRHIDQFRLWLSEH
jgi:rubrerythrin